MKDSFAGGGSETHNKHQFYTPWEIEQSELRL